MDIHVKGALSAGSLPSQEKVRKLAIEFRNDTEGAPCQKVKHIQRLINNLILYTACFVILDDKRLTVQQIATSSTIS